MRSSADARTASPDDLPGGLSSMWRPGQARLPRRTASPGVRVRHGRSFAALPDALARAVAEAHRGGRDRRRPHTRVRRRRRPRCVGHGDLVPQGRRRSDAAALPRPCRRSSSSRTSRACRPRYRPSSTTSGPSTSTGSVVLRDQVFTLDHMYMSVFSTAGWILRLGVTIVLLASVSPVLILLVLFALPTVLTASWRPGVERNVEESVAWRDRLARHTFLLGHDRAARQGSAARAALGPRLVEARTETWEQWYAPIAARAMGERVVAHARVGDLRRRVRGRGRVRRRRPRRTGRIACCSCSPRAAGCRSTSARPSARSGSCAASGSTAPAASRGSRTTPRRIDDRADQPVPERITRGIRLEDVSFSYPGHRPPGPRRRRPRAPRRRSGRGRRGERRGQVHAREAAVPLLRARRRARISVDGVDLVAHARPGSGAHASPARSRTSSGSSSAPARPSASATSTVHRRPSCDRGRGGPGGGASTSSTGSPTGSTRSSASRGTTASRCRSVSGRSSPWPVGFMRDHPLLVVLDEPTAALDAETEHALFEQYAASRASRKWRSRRAYHRARLAPLLDGPHGRPDRRARRRARGRGRDARRTDGERRPVCRAVRHPGRRLPLKQTPADDFGYRSTASRASTMPEP